MERLKSSLRKFYGRYGDLIKHYEVSLFQMLHDILGHDHIQWHPQLIRDYTNLRTYYRTGLYYRFWPYYQILGFLRTLQRVRLANRGRLLLQIPGPVPFGTCICSNFETILSLTCHVYGPFEFRISLGTSILPSVLLLFRAVLYNGSIQAKCSINIIQIIMQVLFTLNVCGNKKQRNLNMDLFPFIFFFTKIQSLHKICFVLRVYTLITHFYKMFSHNAINLLQSCIEYIMLIYCQISEVIRVEEEQQLCCLIVIKDISRITTFSRIDHNHVR